MQNDRIQGILFDAERVVRFDKPTLELSQKSVNARKTLKKLTGRLYKHNKKATETLHYELIQGSHKYTTVRPLYRTHSKTIIKK